MVAPRSDTWMPFYVGDYLADTMHLTTEQHGAYALLLMAGWKRRGKLPDDDEQLALITRLTVKRWREIRPVIAAFFSVTDGAWHQKRLSAEIEKAEHITKVRSEARKGKTKPPSTKQQNDNKTPSNDQSPADQNGIKEPYARVTRVHEPSQSQKEEPPKPPLTNGRYVDKPDDVLFAFYEIRRLIWETPPPGSYSPKDISVAKGWLEKAHGDSEPLRALFEREMRRMGERGAPPPGTPWFFHNSVDDAAASGWAGYAS